MAIEMDPSSLQGRIIKLVMEKYPITQEQIAKELHMTVKRIKPTIIKLRTRGIITEDRLPDCTYLRLARFDIKFHGRKADQRRPIKHKSGRKKDKKKGNGPDHHEHMYG